MSEDKVRMVHSGLERTPIATHHAYLVLCIQMQDPFLLRNHPLAYAGKALTCIRPTLLPVY